MAPLATTGAGTGTVLNRWLDPGQVLDVTADLISLRSPGAFHSIADLLLNGKGGGGPGTAGFSGVVNVSIGATACGVAGAYVMPLSIATNNMSISVSSSSGRFSGNSVVVGGGDTMSAAAFDMASFAADDGGKVVSPPLLAPGTAWTSDFLFPTGADRTGFVMGLPAGTALSSPVRFATTNNASQAESVARLVSAPLTLKLGAAGAAGYATSVGVSLPSSSPLLSVADAGQKFLSGAEDPMMPLARGIVTDGYTLGLDGTLQLAFNDGASATSATNPVRLLTVKTASWMGALGGVRLGDADTATGAQFDFDGLALIDLDSNGGAILGASGRGVSPSITSVRLPQGLLGDVSGVHAALTQLHARGLARRPDYRLGLAAAGAAGTVCSTASINAKSTSITPVVKGGTWFASKTAPPPGDATAPVPLLIDLDISNKTCQTVLQAQLQGSVQVAALTAMRAATSAGMPAGSSFALAKTLASTGLPSLQLPPAPGGGVSTNTNSDAQPYVEAPKADSTLGVTQTLTNPTSLHATVSKIVFTVETCAANCSKLFPASNETSSGHTAFVACCLEGDSATMGKVDLEPHISLPPRDSSKAGLPGVPKTVDTSLVMGSIEQGNSSVANVLALLSAGAMSGLDGSPVLLHGSAIISILPQGRTPEDGLGSADALNLTLDI